MTGEITKQEALELVLKHGEKFEILLKAGVFDLTDGKTTINHHGGRIQAVHVEERRYQHKGEDKRP